MNSCRVELFMPMLGATRSISQDPNGQLPLPIITGLIGAGAGAVGNLIGQLSDQCHPFSWSSLLVATGGWICSWCHSAVCTRWANWRWRVGRYLELWSYLVGNAVQGQAFNTEDAAYSVAGGIVGGVFGGAADRASPWGYGGTAASRAAVDASNAAANLRANLNSTSTVGNLTGGIASNLPRGGGSQSCGCGNWNELKDLRKRLAKSRDVSGVIAARHCVPDSLGESMEVAGRGPGDFRAGRGDLCSCVLLVL